MLERFTGSFKNEKEPEIIYWRMKKEREREREREGQVLLETDKFVKESNGI